MARRLKDNLSDLSEAKLYQLSRKTIFLLYCILVSYANISSYIIIISFFRQVESCFIVFRAARTGRANVIENGILAARSLMSEHKILLLDFNLFHI